MILLGDFKLNERLLDFSDSDNISLKLLYS